MPGACSLCVGSGAEVTCLMCPAFSGGRPVEADAVSLLGVYDGASRPLNDGTVETAPTTSEYSSTAS